MHVKQNIGIVNALIRITIGLTLLSWTTAKLVKAMERILCNDWFLSAMKVAEGIVRYCPVTDFFRAQRSGRDWPPLKQIIDFFVPKQSNETKDETSHKNSSGTIPHTDNPFHKNNKNIGKS